MAQGDDKDMNDTIEGTDVNVNVIDLMNQKLPLYVVNCLKAAGFDSVDAICSTNVSNLIDVVENFVEQYYNDYPDYFANPNGCIQPRPFKFPPGHRTQIFKFITDVQGNSKTGEKRKSGEPNHIRKTKVQKQSFSSTHVSNSSIESDDDTIAAVSKQVRCSISTWAHKQPDTTIQSLKENKDFSLIAKTLNGSLSVAIKCIPCGTTVQLQRNSKIPCNFILSNWTRHVKTCRVLAKQGMQPKCLNLHKFFLKSGSNTSTSNTIQSNSSSSNSSHLGVSKLNSSPLVSNHLGISSPFDSGQSDISSPLGSSQSGISSPLDSGQSGISSPLDSSHSGISQLSNCSSETRSLHTSTLDTIVSTPHVQSPLSRVMDTVEHGEHVLSFSTNTDNSVGSDLTVTTKPNIFDWSRDGRRQRIKETVGSDPDQLHITDYYTYIDEFDKLICENKKLSLMIKEFNIPIAEGVNDASFSSFPDMLKHLIINATNNANKVPQGRRHMEIIKKFAMSLFIFTGPLAYTFLQQNLTMSLPCLRTVQSHVYSQYSIVNEGEFRFDGLLQHINRYRLSAIVTIAEDATRVISRVEYDNQTDRCVGFVLPINEQGLPIVDSYLATSYERIEEIFSSSAIAKYAYVYIAKPLDGQAPAFCLGCVGSDNKFNANTVLSRWKYITNECQKRGIHVVSYGGDGDSRIMKAMQICTGLFVSNSLTDIPISALKSPRIPESWHSWFRIHSTSAVVFVQDTVHIAVKLKSRLLKPSVVLPMGNYVAGLHHLSMLHANFGKDQHGLRQKDIDLKDKQNFDAVLNIIRAAPHLQNIPDALGTRQLIDIIQCVVESYMNKSLEPMQRIEKIWFAVLFLRFWRSWIVVHPLYSVQKNFITSNTFKCIELNAHALVIAVMVARDNFEGKPCFLPWILGSQSCEQAFRSVRSMSNIFATSINFGMLGLLRRLHRLDIISSLKAESKDTGIKYPAPPKHKLQCEGSPASEVRTSSFKCFTDAKIKETLEKAEHKARLSIEALGMRPLLEKHKLWDTPPRKPDDDDDDEKDDDDVDEKDDDDVDDEEDDGCDGDELEDDSLDSLTLAEEAVAGKLADIEEDMKVLNENHLIGQQAISKLHNFRKCFRKLPSTSIPLFCKIPPKDPQNYQEKEKMQGGKFTPFVQIKFNSKEVYIRKSTAVWLLQEGERVSPDRLIRVRATQPFSSTAAAKQGGKAMQNDEDESTPVIESKVKIGDLCVFKSDNASKWCIGKVLKFSKFRNKKLKDQEYKGVAVDVSTQNMGVLCTWFIESETSLEYNSKSQIIDHTYIPVSNYICTLTRKSFDIISSCNVACAGISTLSSHQQDVISAEKITLTQQCQTAIADLLHKSGSSTNCCKDQIISIENSAEVSNNVVYICDEEEGDGCSDENIWVTFPNIRLSKSDKEIILNVNGRLNDKHMKCAQYLIRKRFPRVGGLRSTLLQQKKVIPLEPNSLQIVHIPGHWIAISTMHLEDEDIVLYDSLSSNISDSTAELLAQFVHTSKSQFTIKVPNLTKQSGSSECGLYAIAYITHLAFELDPSLFVFKQELMRHHFIKCIESEAMEPFPTLRQRRQIVMGNTFIIDVHCYCRCPDDGSAMVLCDGVCGRWYHIDCLDAETKAKAKGISKKKKWYCRECTRCS